MKVIPAIVAGLRGTANDLSDEMAKYDLPAIAYDAVDDLVSQHIFKCDKCGYWQDVSEQSPSEEWVCCDCTGENEAED